MQCFLGEVLHETRYCCLATRLLWRQLKPSSTSSPSSPLIYRNWNHYIGTSIPGLFHRKHMLLITADHSRQWQTIYALMWINSWEMNSFQAVTDLGAHLNILQNPSSAIYLSSLTTVAAWQPWQGRKEAWRLISGFQEAGGTTGNASTKARSHVVKKAQPSAIFRGSTGLLGPNRSCDLSCTSTIVQLNFHSHLTVIIYE